MCIIGILGNCYFVSTGKRHSSTKGSLIQEDEFHETGPVSVYLERVRSGELQRDEHQLKLIEQLQALHGNLKSYEPKPLPGSGFFSKVRQVESWFKKSDIKLIS